MRMSIHVYNLSMKKGQYFYVINLRSSVYDEKHIRNSLKQNYCTHSIIFLPS